MSRLKSGGLFPPATGLKPCSVGSRSHNAIGNCNPVIKATKNGGSHPTVSFTPALVLMTKEKSQSKAGGQRYLAIKGHARPCLTYYIYRRFTLTGYFVAVAGIEPATPPSWVVASFLAAGDCWIRTSAYQLHGIPIFQYLFIV